MSIHFENIIIDGHNDTMMRVLDQLSWQPQVNIGEATDFHIDLGKLEAGGLDAPMFAAFSEGYYDGEQDIAKSLSRTLAIINGLYYTEALNRERFRILNRSGDIVENFRQGRLGAIPSIEGSYFIDSLNNQEILGQLKDLGVKVMGFNWNYSNYLAEGAAELYSDGRTPSEGGLTDLGQEVLGDMEDLGLGIDVSHMNEASFWGVVENYRGPIIATHSGAYSVRAHRRNLKDDQLEAIRDSGGLVGAVLCSSFITEDKPAYLSQFVDHIDYMVEKIGIDHVGLGSDFDGTTIPADLKDASELEKISQLMLERGYSQEDLKKFLGGNYLRVFRDLEARELEVEKLDVQLRKDYQMGSRLGEDKILRASFEGLEGRASLRIILDGLVLSQEDLEAREIEIDLRDINQEIFHILTLELEQEGRIFRDTTIISR